MFKSKFFKATLPLAIASLLVAVTYTGNAAGNDVWTVQDKNFCETPESESDVTCFAVGREYLKNGKVFPTPTVAALQNAAKEYAAYGLSHSNNFDPNAFTAKAILGSGLALMYGITGTSSGVIAIVDAYDSPLAYSHVSKFRSTNDLPAITDCSSRFDSKQPWPTNTDNSPCFVKTNQTLGTSSLPVYNSGWANEIDLDVQAVSAICPKCEILLVEGNSASLLDLGTAISNAGGLSYVVAISNSYGTSGDLSQTKYANWNIVGASKNVYASSGDNGYQRSASFPASSTNVIGVGGTTVYGTSNADRTETAWSGAGSGCSAYNSKPSWQSKLTLCSNLKSVSDISAVADPNSGLTIFTTYKGIEQWVTFGGTSLAAPVVAAIQVRQGGFGKSDLSSPSNFKDVTSGSNGSCRNAICKAGIGWDGPTGFGTKNVN